MYKITLISNIFLLCLNTEGYDLSKLEEDIDEKAESFFDKDKMTWSSIFILPEEKAIYFKTKYNHFIKSIEEIKEEIGE